MSLQNDLDTIHSRNRNKLHQRSLPRRMNMSLGILNQQKRARAGRQNSNHHRKYVGNTKASIYGTVVCRNLAWNLITEIQFILNSANCQEFLRKSVIS